MTDKAAPDCSGCRWRWDVFGSFACHLSGDYVKLERATGACGPSGRYFEPKEKEQ